LAFVACSRVCFTLPLLLLNLQAQYRVQSSPQQATSWGKFSSSHVISFVTFIFSSTFMSSTVFYVSL